MIFKPDLVTKIDSGRKTMTRRPVKGTEATCRYVMGRDYAVQRKSGGAEILRIRITSVRQEPLGEITAQDAIAEGFKNTDRFFAYWEQLYEHVDHDQPVWVLSFTKLDEQPLLLGRRVGYTHHAAFAMKEEPEAVEPYELERINNRRERDQKLWERERKMIEGSIGRLTADTEMRLACHREIRALQRQLDALDRKLRSAA